MDMAVNLRAKILLGIGKYEIHKLLEQDAKNYIVHVFRL
jgi:hypothetical protein